MCVGFRWTPFGEEISWTGSRSEAMIEKSIAGATVSVCVHGKKSKSSVYYDYCRCYFESLLSRRLFVSVVYRLWASSGKQLMRAISSNNVRHSEHVNRLPNAATKTGTLEQTL